MAVPKFKRKPSSVQFVQNARNLRTYVTVLLLRDFGIKEHIRDIKTYPENVQNNIKSEMSGLNMSTENGTEDNQPNSINITQQKVHEVFPDWFLNYSRTNIMNTLSDLQKNIIVANGIYISSDETYEQRKCYLNLAIANCKQFVEEFEYMIDVFNCQIDVNKLLKYIDMANTEINLLKGVRKSDKKALGKIKAKKEAKTPEVLNKPDKSNNQKSENLNN